MNTTKFVSSKLLRWSSRRTLGSGLCVRGGNGIRIREESGVLARQQLTIEQMNVSSRILFIELLIINCLHCE